MKKTLLSICFLPLLVSARIGNSSSSRHEPIIEEVEEQLQDNRKLSLNRAFNIANNIFNKNIFGNNNEDDDAECCCCENSDNTTVPTQSPMPSTMNSFSSSPTIEPKLYACPSMMNKVAVKFRKKNPSFDPPVLNPLEQKSFSSLSCPNPKDPPVEVSPEASIEIENSPLLDTLCTLTFLQYNPNGDDIIIPIGKTYDGHNWELSGGPFIHSIQFDCSSSSSSCIVVTPSKPDSSPQSKFQLISFQLSSSSSQLKSQNIAARFFEQVTFGTKRSDIAPYTDLPNMGDSSARHDLDSDLAQWAHDQMYTEGETSFRAHFRRNSNTRLRNVENIGKPNHVCSENTRWHKYAFTNIAEAPLYMYVTIKEVTMINGETAYSFSQGGVVITELHEDDAIVEESWDGQPEGVLPPGTYQLCEAQEIFGKYGYISLRSESLTDGVCRNYKYGNPPIQFLSAENQPLNVFEMATLDDFIPVPGTLDDSGDYLLPGGINDPDKCNFYSNSGSHYPIYALLDDGTYMIFDPTLELMENTIEAPLYDGGNSAYISGSYCPSAFRTFLNAEDGCVYTDEVPACSNDNVTPDLEIELSDENLKTLHDLTESYPYVVSGLRVENLGNPCVRKGETSRFKRTGLSESQCPETNLMDDKTNDVLVGLLYEDYEDRNNFIRDVYFWNRDAYCSIPENADLTANPLHVYADDECWLLIHPDEDNVFDFFSWVSLHPGGADKITNFAENEDSAILTFPTSHEMWRWENNKEILHFLGVHNDIAAFRDFSPGLQTGDVKDFFDISGTSVSTKKIVCGSTNEVANDMSKGDTGLSMTIEYEIDGLWEEEYMNQKYGIWLEIVQTSPDQLRQRVSWALSQIFAISQNAVEEENKTEGYMNYYDIFVRHAFGNYFDILKETSYSGLMAKMLTYLRSISTAYVFEEEGSIEYADENFAREIMQLFSIGLVMLDMNGSPILDENGNEILTYTNDHIMSYARAWTGFDVQAMRANIERSDFENTIDPMKIIPEWRDAFPKINLSGGFIGDGYPLCDDLPPLHHMKKGATYRLLGGSAQPEMQTDIPEWYDPEYPLVFIDLKPQSSLYKKLCNKPNGGTGCNFQSQITLDENLECFGEECEVDTLRLLDVGDGVYFEYIRQPCVELSYFNNAKTLLTDDHGRQQVCGNPFLESGGAACCYQDYHEGALNTPCQYSVEKMTLATAQDRCADLGMEICEYKYLWSEDESPECYDTAFHHFWHGSDCLVKLKVANNGRVAIVHEPQFDSEHHFYDDDPLTEKITHKLQPNTPNFFQIDWSECNFPTVNDNCNDGACEVVGEDCVCHTSVEESQVFFSAPDSIEDVMESLFIGSVSPDTYDDGQYSAPITIGGGIKIHFRAGTSQSYDKETIFEVEHLSKIYYFKNVESVVNVIDPQGRETPYKFRNPPHFMSFHEPHARDAHYETDAVLESYFYHPNTAPFLAIHFIQRFGTSNPSPRYVNAVATAFKNGIYEYETSAGSVLQYGSGKYGDMAALTASVLFDREARSVVMDLDLSSGSLREPLLKVTNVFRSMEYEPFEDVYQFTRYGRMISNDVTHKIGQMAFDIQSVFSFFRREFIPTIGPVGQASLVSPESQRYTTPTMLGTLDGLFSLIKFGLMECYGGFGPWMAYNEYCWEVESETSNEGSIGRLSYDPQNSYSTEEIIEELATLLTAGRLNDESKQIIKDHFENAADDGYGLRLAQQLIVSTPEFHSTDLLQFSGEKRPPPQPPQTSSNPYKAVVYILLEGGMDSYNLIVPHSGCTGTSFPQYEIARGSVALSKSTLLQIDTSSSEQPCSTFGVHPQLPVLRDIYDDEELTFYANTGVLFEEVNQMNWETKTPTQLFAHNTQVIDSQQVDPYQEASGSGVLGRMADVLTEKGFKTGSYSVDGNSNILPGSPGLSQAPFSVQAWGIEEFNQRASTSDMEEHLRDLNNIAKSTSGKFGKYWGELFDDGLNQYNLLKDTLEGAESNEEFPQDSYFAQQLRTVSLLMKERESLGNDRQFFFTQMGGFDTHENQFVYHDELLPELNQALDAFVREMKSQNLWDDVTVVVASEFARTMHSNSGDGTDHAWGGNYFTMGGSTKGGKMLGKFPEDLTDDGPLSIGTGRLIPTTSWDAIYNGVAEWMDVTSDEDLDKVLPNRKNFNTLYSRSDMYTN